jgi:phosphoglucomutase
VLTAVFVGFRYGRNYYTRYDYESVESAKADKVMSLLESKMVRSHACQSVAASNAEDP